MVNVSTTRILADCLKTNRIYYVLEPFLNNVTNEEINKLDSEILNESKETNQRSTSGLKLLRDYHNKVIENYELLKNKEVFFITGTSHDYSEGKIGYDPLALSFKLSDEILDMTRELNGIENIIFFPISPVIAPFYIKNEELRYVFENQIAEINLENPSKIPLGNLPKKINDYIEKHGLYQFNEAIYENKIAKKFISKYENKDYFKLKEKIPRTIKFNKQITAIAIKSFLNYLSIPNNKIDIYSAKSSYAYQILELAIKNTMYEISPWNIMNNIKMPLKGELEKKALSRLKTRLKNRLLIKNDNIKNSIEDLLGI